MLATCRFCAASNSPTSAGPDAALSYLHQQQSNRPPATSAPIGINVHMRGVIQQRTNTTVNQIYSAINPDDQLDTIERLFAYLWDLQANNNAVSSAQDSFYINWNIENIWLKWETNTEKLPEHISQILPSNENGGDQSNILYIVAKHLADPILLYLSGPSPEDSQSEMTNESMPDQITAQGQSDSAQDFDTLPARLLSLLFFSLDVQKDHKDLALLNVINSSLAILHGPRRTDHTFVAVIAAFAIHSDHLIKQLMMYAMLLPSELRRDEPPNASKMALVTLSSFLEILEENKVHIPFVSNLQIGMSTFLGLVEAQLPKLSALIRIFIADPSSSLSSSSAVAFLEVSTPIIKIVETLVRLTFRHQGELPSETCLDEFSHALSETFHSILSQSRRLGRGNGVLPSITARLEHFAVSLLRLVHIADESTTSSYQLPKKSTMMDALNGILETCRARSGEGENGGARRDVPCRCVATGNGLRECHQCHMVEQLIRPKNSLIAQRVTDGVKRDIDSLDAWYDWVSPAVAAPGASGEQNRPNWRVLGHALSQRQEAAAAAALASGTEAKPQHGVAGLDDLDLGALAVSTARNCGIAFADVGIRYKT
ncbi:MAG: hypothetical protein SGCHY_003109 [Lobulomycetales sp.]